ncbi:hypothetical protein [Sinomicrobium weinanense]|uniref:Adhesin domain-containing protein n=1 Tax=Sinomicrobium weinanense TaxID=2842200 RepID=A0A926Q1X0_9FLAO|nr:hypothetical protein [Sinomicrobium weinanense]MBC9795968.1 hypothetical protein [Sinomicrobium weinanense]MBU3122087.1 hypothetical protein [Sinomicrobium weinanense]
MKRTGYKIVLLLAVLFPLLTTASALSGDQDPKWNGKHSKEKRIKKSFNVNSNALLEVNNSYGNIYITSWNENRIEIDVLIKVNGNNEGKVQQKLDQIDVDFEAGKSRVAARTIFGNKKWSWGGNNNMSMEINYTIKLPVNNSVDLSNDYGGIQIDEINGKAKISCDYGKLEIGELRADGNELSFDYTSKSSISYMKSGSINADYSGFVLEKAEKLSLNADYTSSSILEIGALEYSCDYGDLSVESAKNVHGTGDYLSTKFGTVHGDVNITSDYGSIKIEELAADAGNVTLETEFTGIKIGYNSNYHFNFEIVLEYTGLKGDTDFEYEIKRVKSSEKYYKGHYGSSPGNKLSITSEYGGITLYKK